MSSEMLELLRLLGTRYEEARRDLDELRVRALELVVAACVAESRERPIGEIPPPGRMREPLLTDEVTAVKVAPSGTLGEGPVATPEPETEPEPESAPRLEPDLDEVSEPEPVQLPARESEATVVDSPETDEMGGAHWPPRPVEASDEPPVDDRPPEEPVRGAWEPPRR